MEGCYKYFLKNKQKELQLSHSCSTKKNNQKKLRQLSKGRTFSPFHPPPSPCIYKYHKLWSSIHLSTNQTSKRTYNRRN